MAFAPASRIDFAVPASHALYSSSGAPLTWRSANRAAFSTWFVSASLCCATSDPAAPRAPAGSRIPPALTGPRLQLGPTRVGPPTAVSKTHSLPDLTNTFLSVSWAHYRLCRCNHKAGAWEMHANLADLTITASDHDLMDVRGDQFTDNRIASSVVRRHGNGLARFSTVGILGIDG